MELLHRYLLLMLVILWSVLCGSGETVSAEPASSGGQLAAAVQRGSQFQIFEIAGALRRSSDPWEQAEAVEALVKSARGSGRAERLLAIEALGLIGSAREDALDLLASGIESSDPIERYRSVVALARLRPYSGRIGELLRRAVLDSSQVISERATQALLSLPTPTPEALAPRALLRRPASGAAGRRASPRAALRRPDPKQKSDPQENEAERLLEETANESAVQPDIDELAAAIVDDDARVRFAAAYSLAELGKPALEPLSEALAHPRVEVRLNALTGLQELAEKHPEAVSILLSSLKDENFAVRLYAALIVSAAPSEQLKSVPVLIEALEYPDEGIRRRVAAAFKRAPRSAALISLQQALRHESPVVRSGAAEVLKELKPKDEDVITALRSLLKDDYPFVREKAAEALDAIEVS